MTFLEWLLTRLIGPAARQGREGESYWHCPFAGNHANGTDHDPSFHTMPTKPGYKHRWICFSCPEDGNHRGDEWDLLRRFFPADSWPVRQKRMAELRAEWERDGNTESTSTYSTHRGRTGSERSSKPCPKCNQPGMAGDHDTDIHTEVARVAFAELRSIEFARNPLAFAEQVLRTCSRHRLDPCRFATFVRSVMIGHEEESRHDAHEAEARANGGHCRKSDCVYPKCRQSRRLTPLTAKEVGERILKELREERRREDAIREITEWEADPLNPKWRAESCRR